MASWAGRCEGKTQKAGLGGSWTGTCGVSTPASTRGLSISGQIEWESRCTMSLSWQNTSMRP